MHYDNAPAHTSLLVREFLAKNNTIMLPQPSYSSDLPFRDVLFPKPKRPMKGRRYVTIQEIKTSSKEQLNKITKNDFLKCFEHWKTHWHKYIISDGNCFECWKNTKFSILFEHTAYKLNYVVIFELDYLGYLKVFWYIFCELDTWNYWSVGDIWFVKCV